MEGLTQAERLMREVAQLTLARDQERNRLNLKLLHAGLEHEPALKALEAKIKTREEKIAALVKEFPGLVSTGPLLLSHGKLFTRTGPPALALLGESSTWKEIVENLTQLNLKEYLRFPDPEVNKRKLLEDRDKLTPTDLKEIGIKIERSEKLYIEPNLIAAEVSGAISLEKAA
jgi:hypothetical protein